MKPTLYTTLCFFFFAFTTYFPLPITQAEPVKDVNGNYVLVTGRYVILPDPSTNGGELKLGNTKNATCNLTILQSYDHVGDGLPLKFIPQARSKNIFTDEGVDIKFENKPECAESSKWVMVEADDDYPTPWIAVDGIQKYKKLKKGSFVIGLTPSETSYCIKFCYQVSLGFNECYHVSKKNDENGMRLVVVESSQDIFGIVFKPVGEATNGRSVV